MQREEITITITNWYEYQCKHDFKADWFKFHHSFFDHPKLDGCSSADILLFIYLLAAANRSSSATFGSSLLTIGRRTAIKRRQVIKSLEKLQSIHWVQCDLCMLNSAIERRDRDKIEKRCTFEHQTPLLLPPTPEANPPMKLTFDFESIYQDFPRKMGKSRGLEICKKKITTEKDFEDLKFAVKRYREHIEREGRPAEYILYFSTFMNQWRDWLNPETGASFNGMGRRPSKVQERQQKNEEAYQDYVQSLEKNHG